MRGICFDGIQQVAWKSLADARIEASTDVVVNVEMAGLCGSDLHPYFGRETGLDHGTVMGHEFVGRIVAVGDQVTQLSTGQRVFAPFTTNCGKCFFCSIGLTSRCEQGQLFGWRCNGQGLHGGQAELVRVPLAESTLLTIPDHIPPELALLLGDNLSTAFYCASMADIPGNKLVAIIGCGCVGLLSILAAREISGGQIVAIDKIPQRLEKAKQLGAIPATPDEAADVISNLTKGRGADSVMELVGLAPAQKLAYELLRPGGTMSVIGCHSSPSFAFTPAEAYDKNLTYRTGRSSARCYMQQLLERPSWLASIDLNAFITHRFEAADGVRAYEIFAHQKDGCIKAVLDFS